MDAGSFSFIGGESSSVRAGTAVKYHKRGRGARVFPDNREAISCYLFLYIQLMRISLKGMGYVADAHSVWAANTSSILTAAASACATELTKLGGRVTTTGKSWDRGGRRIRPSQRQPRIRPPRRQPRIRPPRRPPSADAGGRRRALIFGGRRWRSARRGWRARNGARPPPPPPASPSATAKTPPASGQPHPRRGRMILGRRGLPSYPRR